MFDAIPENLEWAIALLVALVVVTIGIVVFRMMRFRTAKALVVTIEQRPTYLHAIVEGRNTTENIWRYFERIMQECRARNCYRVLVEERLDGPRLDAAEVFDIASKASTVFLGKFEIAAFVDVSRDDPLMDFAQLVATNRGLPVAVFPTVAEAEQWLLTARPDVVATPQAVTLSSQERAAD